MSDQRIPPGGANPRTVSVREFILAALAVTAGAGIAWVDARPRWDDTGVTVVALLVAAGCAAGAGLRWWAAALLVAAPMFVAELRSAGWGISVSLAFAGAGALLGVAVRRVFGGGRVK